MKGQRHSEEQILYALRQAEGGEKATEICRKMGISEQTFYTWKRKYAGMGISELRELRQLREENRKLKTLVADLTLDKHMLQEVLSKKVQSLRAGESWAGFYKRLSR
jgi:putative transposase